MGDHVDFQVRPGTLADVDEVMEIESVAEEAPHWGRDVYVGMVGEGGGKLMERKLLVAVDGENVIGFAVGKCLPGDAAELESVVVHAPWRRRRVAHGLCAAVMAWAKECGAGAVELEVRASNEAGQRLYGVIGFVEAGRRPKYYRDPVEDAVLMRCELAKS